MERKGTLYITWSVNLDTAANVDPVNIYTVVLHLFESLCVPRVHHARKKHL